MPRQCPLCGGDLAGEYRAREMMLGTREPFTYAQCAACASLVLADVPDDLDRYYPDDYYSLAPRRSRSAPVRVLRRLRGRAAARGWRRLAKLLGGGSEPIWAPWIDVAGLDREAAICDIGCGGGELLFDLAAAGFPSPVGADPMIESPLERDGVRIHRAPASGISGSFDLVMFNHAFEHLREPLSELAAARRLLAPGGTLMVRAPVAGCWAWRHYGTDWVGLDPPRHTFVPSPAGLRAAAAAVGLEVYAEIYDSTEMQFWRSEQYRADVGLFEPGSHQLDPAGSRFDAHQLREWRHRAERLNASRDGDTAGTFLRVAPGG